MFPPMHVEPGESALINSPREAARAWLNGRASTILETQIELARVPAPTFSERARAELIARLLDGLDTHYDEVGNLIAAFPNHSGAINENPVVIAAHVDTVFGPDVPIRIRREGNRWVGPGIVDNARGLAVVITVLRALASADVVPARPLLVAFTVGEEGKGDLRGVKHLFRDASPLRAAAAFVAVDGSGIRRVIHRALGSRRYRIVARGTGGHSWTDWGRPNPANAIGSFIHRITELELPQEPRTTLTVARLGGGTSINAIPAESWVELDTRSVNAEALLELGLRIEEALTASIALEEARAEGSLEAAMETIGERPAGALSASHALVRAAEEATRAFGEEPEQAVSSTDANVPLALGIPAIAIGAGGLSGDTHTESEWFEDTDGAAGALRLLDVLAAAAGF